MKNFLKVTFILLLLLLPQVKVQAFTDESCRYQVYVQNKGWMSTVSTGATAGTVGQALRMEAIAIASDVPNIKLEYQVHVSNIGWMPVNAEGSIAGVTGQGIEAIAIAVKDLNGNQAPGYNVSYRAHVSNIGWQNWVHDGNIAGTVGQALPIEAIQINISSNSNILKYRLNGGVGDYYAGASRYYWLDSSLKTSLVTTGVNGWNHSSSYSGVFTKLNWVQTSYRPSSIADYYGAYLPDGILGETKHYKNDGAQINPSTVNWDYCRININISSTATGNGTPLSDWEYVKTSSHETGHVLGFYENNNQPNSIMCQSRYDSRKYNYPIPSDIHALNTMY